MCRPHLLTDTRLEALLGPLRVNQQVQVCMFMFNGKIHQTQINVCLQTSWKNRWTDLWGEEGLYSGGRAGAWFRGGGTAGYRRPFAGGVGAVQRTTGPLPLQASRSVHNSRTVKYQCFGSGWSDLELLGRVESRSRIIFPDPDKTFFHNIRTLKQYWIGYSTWCE